MKFIESMKKIFELPPASVLALKELETAKRSLLEAQSGREYAESMVKYHEARIRRLTIYVHSLTEGEQA
jgi:hypothetical protein